MISLHFLVGLTVLVSGLRSLTSAGTGSTLDSLFLVSFLTGLGGDALPLEPTELYGSYSVWSPELRHTFTER